VKQNNKKGKSSVCSNGPPRVRFLLEELRAPFFTASVVPIVLGAAVAWAVAGIFRPFCFLLTLIGGVFLHAGCNVANDYFDHKSGCDRVNVDYVRPFTGGSRLIQRGLLSPRAVLAESLILYALGSFIGLYLAWARGLPVLWLGIIGIFCSFFYTAPPFRLANLGLGELAVGLNFGVLMTLGSYYVQTQALAWEPAVAALPVAFLITGVLYINQFPDYKADKTVGKAHWVVRLGLRKGVIGYIAIMTATYLSLILGVAFGLVSPFALLGLLTFPMALRAVWMTRKYYAQPSHLVPANAGTVMVHLFTGGLISIGYVADKVVGYFI